MKTRILTLATVFASLLGGASAASAATLTGAVTVEGRPATAIVMVEKLASAPTTAEVAQENLQFAPGTVTVAKGATISFPNKDNVFHSVYSTSEGNAFDLGLYAKGPGKKAVMKSVGTVEVKCRVHAHMKATIKVVDVAAAQPTNAEGAFAMQALAPGHYRVLATLPDGGMKQAYVEVKDAAPARVAIDFAAQAATLNADAQPDACH